MVTSCPKASPMPPARLPMLVVFADEDFNFSAEVCAGSLLGIASVSHFLSELMGMLAADGVPMVPNACHLACLLPQLWLLGGRSIDRTSGKWGKIWIWGVQRSWGHFKCNLFGKELPNIYVELFCLIVDEQPLGFILGKTENQNLHDFRIFARDHDSRNQLLPT